MDSAWNAYMENRNQSNREKGTQDKLKKKKKKKGVGVGQCRDQKKNFQKTKNCQRSYYIHETLEAVRKEYLKD